MDNIKADDYVALKDVPDALWVVARTYYAHHTVRHSQSVHYVDVFNSAFAAYKEHVSVDDITKHITKAEAKHIK